MTIKEELSENCKNLPEILDFSVDMPEPNSPVMIYEGEFEIKYESFEIKVEGIIQYDWFPNSGVRFSGEVAVGEIDLFKISMSQSVIILVNGLEFSQGFITTTNFGNSEISSHIEGKSFKKVVFGDKTIAVNKLRFSIPNLRDFRGMAVKKKTEGNTQILRSRLTLENNNYIITLDKCPDFTKRQDSLEKKGGFNILYAGELINKKGSIDYEDTRDILNCLNAFLSFLNGRRTSALFIQGVYESDVIWCDFSNHLVDSYKAVNSWPQFSNVDSLNKIWFKFSEFWKDSDSRDFLTSLIHWYVEANCQAGFTEGSIIMAQTALELIYNWWIIEDKKLIIGKDSENINASNKIRLLLSQLNISHSVPISFNHLQEYIINNINVIDAPDAVVQIRNAIVHSQEEKRRKLSEINLLAKYEALQLSIWYIEMSLLCILGFDDKYQNRCSGVSEVEEYVPWTKRNKEII